VARLMKVLDPSLRSARNTAQSPSDEDGRCCQ
jgi:hypothetical protein